MTTFEVTPIAVIQNNEKGTFIKVDVAYRPALTALQGFSHINVFWWFSDFDQPQFRSIVETQQPYVNAPEKMGIFATRSPIRPNPIALTTVEILCIDQEQGILQLAYIDANDQTPVLDIKPYTPSYDRVEKPSVPTWCAHWPNSLEESASFAWEDVFTFS